MARAPVAEDRDAYLSVFMDPAIEEWLRPAPLPPFREEELAGMLEDDVEHWRRHGFGPWALVDPDTDELVGRGGLRWTTVEERLAVELPWTVGSRYQSRGIATEAATLAIGWAAELRIQEVVALVLPQNSASRRVAEKAGMERSGEVEHAGLPHLLYRCAPGSTNSAGPGGR
jgi:ribosomal-protein-alanine N-acetyltransferase